MASEKDIEGRLCQRLNEGVAKPETLTQISLARFNAGVSNLAALVAGHPFDVVQDSSDWNTHPGLMVDIIGGMTPDIVLRSTTSGENRILIEVKQHARLGHDEDACQLTRYFLHLLATSTQSKGQDIQRAVILAAPEAWFEDPTNAGDWERFTSRFGPLAAHFGIVLAKLHTPAEAS